jgi:hypothetical protein
MRGRRFDAGDPVLATRVMEHAKPPKKHADHRVPLLHDELTKYAVGIAPALPDMNIDPLATGRAHAYASPVATSSRPPPT